MSLGRVKDGTATFPVRFINLSDEVLTLECVVDTGFTDAFCLPSEFVARCGFEFVFEYSATLADGSSVELPVFEGRISWNGQLRRVHILVAGDRPLLGVSMLEGLELRIRFEEGGSVQLLDLAN
jgi:clan AA aspartic protease